MPEYLSKERVVRNDVLVYAEGDPIPEEDRDELKRQGYLKSEPKSADKSQAAPANKAAKRSSNKGK